MFRTDLLRASVPTGKLRPYAHLLNALILSPIRCLIFLSLTLISVSSATAQWTMVAPKLVGRPSNNFVVGGGAIVHKSGNVWAGFVDLFLSKDGGLNWEKRTCPVRTPDALRHIDFFDDSVGLLASERGDIWLTKDQGVSWKRINQTSGAFDARFVGSVSNIVVAQGFGGVIFHTTDQGQTWSQQKLGSFAPFIVPLLGGSAYALVGTGRLGAQLFLTTDRGATWTATPDSAGYDSYSFGVDPCSPERVYVANEDAGGGPQNGSSEIFVSHNSGNTWRTTYTGPIRDIVGSISVASNSIYAQRMNAGILRSTDFGNTWTDIGGPSNNFDTRFVCAVTDNLVIAADREGNIWRTIDAGGDSVHGESRVSSLTSSPDLLFADTLYSCDAPTFDSLIIDAVFCVAPKVASVVIEGDHPQDFTLLSTVPEVLSGSDTLAFTFMPRGNGERRANLRLTLEDSSVIIVPMRGFGKGLTELGMTTADRSTDTLGATVYLPISYESQGEMTGVAMRLTFASDQLEFEAVYDLLGAIVSRPGYNEKTHHLFFADPVVSNGVIGHAAFKVYSGEDACMPVIFDSIHAITSMPECAFAINPRMDAEICIPNDCVAQNVSEYLRYGNLPELNVMQTGSDVLVTADVNFGEVQVRIVNLLGLEVGNFIHELRPDQPLRLSIDRLPSGLYNIEVRSAFGTRVFKQLVM